MDGAPIARNTNKFFTDKWHCTITDETNTTEKEFELWRTGWSTLVQIPKDARPSSVRKLVAARDVKPQDGGTCALALVKTTGSMKDGYEVSVLAGIRSDGSDFKPSDTSSSSDVFAARRSR